MPIPRLSRAQFRRLVREAIDRLPTPVQEMLHNVDVEVRWRPTPWERRQAGVRPGEPLFGLYLGTPLPQRDSSYTMTLPDRIVIYQEPHERFCRSHEELVEQVRVTLLHEIGHYLGMDEDRLQELGLE
jgi:predicted Zn-dependent protease with MMP-like domain